MIDPELCLPTMRSRLEKQLDLIAKGQSRYLPVVQHSLKMILAKFKYFVEKIHKMDSLFELHFATLENTEGKKLSKCGNCNKYMKFIGTRPCRLHCESCDVTYGLPQGGKIKIYMEHTCPLDGFELVLFTAEGQNGIIFPLCPNCFNNPPFEDMAKGIDL
jgi:DNA topoisomerase-3